MIVSTRLLSNAARGRAGISSPSRRVLPPWAPYLTGGATAVPSRHVHVDASPGYQCSRRPLSAASQWRPVRAPTSCATAAGEIELLPFGASRSPLVQTGRQPTQRPTTMVVRKGTPAQNSRARPAVTPHHHDAALRCLSQRPSCALCALARCRIPGLALGLPSPRLDDPPAPYLRPVRRTECFHPVRSRLLLAAALVPAPFFQNSLSCR